MEIFKSLQHFASLIPENLKEYKECFPKESNAAEAIHLAISILLNDSIFNSEDDSQITVGMLGFGVHSSWISSLNMVMAGHIDTGYSEIRRAIEFTCYAAKIINSKERASYWLKQRNDPEARSKFSGQFQIPNSYKNDNYKFLRALLMTYDTANYYGAHANLETMIGKIEVAEGSIKFRYQADKEIIYLAAPSFIMSGYRMLQALIIIFGDKVILPPNFKETMSYVQESIRELRLDLANSYYEGKIPDTVKKLILLDNDSETDKMFEEMIEKERLRKESNKKKATS
ncbi:hypothetical protein ACDZ28_32610 [Paenibacillus sp. RS8]|uniref:hypothetical protein n=1 Tax=Paenibacillus sp. RS8 TaxID=3242681 RepID=UPI0035BF272F